MQYSYMDSCLWMIALNTEFRMISQQVCTNAWQKISMSCMRTHGCNNVAKKVWVALQGVFLKEDSIFCSRKVLKILQANVGGEEWT